MALRIWASSTANALGVSCASKSHLAPASSLSRCFSTVLEGLKYASSHEWVKVDGSVATVGITDHAQDHLGEVVFVEVPEPGGSVAQGSSFGAVESVKATSDVNSPISGEIVEVNKKLSESPGLLRSAFSSAFEDKLRKMLHGLGYGYQINSSPYEAGWMIKVKPSNASELESLMGPKEYTKFCEEEAAH